MFAFIPLSYYFRRCVIMEERKTMKKICTVVFAMFLLFVCNASAIGLGGYLNGAYGSERFDENDYNYTSLGGGLILDTAVEKDSLLNYRLEIGYDKKTFDGGGERDKYAMNNTFGFGILRNDLVRIWLGPEVGIYYCETAGGFNYFGGGIGPAIGTNVHLTDLISLSFSADALYQYNIGTESNHDNNQWGEWKVRASVALLFKMGDRYSKKLSAHSGN